MAGERSHELAGAGGPDFDRAVAAGRDDEATIEIHHVDCSPMAHQRAPQIHFVRARHLPHGDRLVLQKNRTVTTSLLRTYE